MTEVKSRILKTENVRWKDLKVIQPSGFKDLSKDAYAKLRQSIIANNFIDPFKVWQKCEDRKEAAKLVLVYSSIYARTTEEGLYQFLNDEKLDFDGLKLEIDLPNIDLDDFEIGWMKDVDDDKLDEVPEVSKEAVSKTGDLFLIDGKHMILCGDSTKRED